MPTTSGFYSHVNYSVTKIVVVPGQGNRSFYSHVNYSVTKIERDFADEARNFYSHVNYSVTKIWLLSFPQSDTFTVT